MEVHMEIREGAHLLARPDTVSPVVSGIRTYSRANCPFCGSAGELLYEGMHDYQFGVPGSWNFRICDDSGCGMIWLDPVPVEQDLARIYSDTDYFGHGESEDRPKKHSVLEYLRELAGSDYLESRWGYHNNRRGPFSRFAGYLMYADPVKRLSLDHSVMFLPCHQNGRLIEIGCGNGGFIAQARSLGWQAEGIDFDPKSVEAARHRGLSIVCGTLEEQTLGADTYDAAVLCHVIEHVHDPLTLLRECYRILRPGSLLVILTPNSSSLGHRIFRRCWLPLDPPRHLHIFNHLSLERLVRQAGFQVRESNSDSSMSRVTFVAGKMLRLTGHYDPWQTWSLSQKLGCLAWELTEMLLGTVNSRVGETLKLIASKPE